MLGKTWSNFRLASFVRLFFEIKRQNSFSGESSLNSFANKEREKGRWNRERIKTINETSLGLFVDENIFPISFHIFFVSFLERYSSGFARRKNDFGERRLLVIRARDDVERCEAAYKESIVDIHNLHYWTFHSI